MQIQGSTIFRAPPEQVYAIFIDQNSLAKATPGIQKLEAVGEDKYEATMKVGVAGITGTYSGTLELQNKRPPNSYTLAVAGEGTPGFLRGTASFEFTLTVDGHTDVVYTWDVQVGGLVAGVGQRVLGGVAKLMVGQFMTAMQKQLEK